jgi:hypothetical protein
MFQQLKSLSMHPALVLCARSALFHDDRLGQHGRRLIFFHE